MNCDHCGAPNATIHMTEIINGEVSEIHLCSKCSKLKTQDYQKHFNMTDFLSDLVELDKEDHEAVEDVVCEQCGLSYEMFKKVGRVGCSHCYHSFHDQLLSLLRKIHTAVRHKGKLPESKSCESIESIISRINELKDHLDRAIKLEEFETAAVIRDEIKNLGQKLK